jgi:hypothetical protein
LNFIRSWLGHLTSVLGTPTQNSITPYSSFNESPSGYCFLGCISAALFILKTNIFLSCYNKNLTKLNTYKHFKTLEKQQWMEASNFL